MSPKFLKLFFLDSPGKIEVNPYPNRQKSPRIRRCGGAQKKVKSAVFGGSEDLEKDSRHLTNMPENLSSFDMNQNIVISLDSHKIICIGIDLVLSEGYFEHFGDLKAKCKFG